jgi:hypothetical protein
MPSFDFPPPPEPHQRLARAVANQWQQQNPFRAAVVRVLARLDRDRPQPSHHLLEHCPETPQEALLDRWCRHWYQSLASTPEGRLQLDLRKSRQRNPLGPPGVVIEARHHPKGMTVLMPSSPHFRRACRRPAQAPKAIPSKTLNSHRVKGVPFPADMLGQ